MELNLWQVVLMAVVVVLLLILFLRNNALVEHSLRMVQVGDVEDEDTDSVEISAVNRNEKGTCPHCGLGEEN